MRALAVRAENLLAALAMGGLMVLPLTEVLLRNCLHIVIPGAAPFELNLTLWVGLLGAAIAAREGKLLTLATGEFLPKGAIEAFGARRRPASSAPPSRRCSPSAASPSRSTEYQSGEPIAFGVQMWMAALVIPFAFGLIALRLAWRASPHVDRPRHRRARHRRRVVDAPSIWTSSPASPCWPWLLALLVAALLGVPIFALLGGIAMVGLLVGMGMLPDFAVDRRA